MDERHSINSKQLLIFVISSQIGFAILTLAGALSKDTGHDGWISIILGGLVMAIFTAIILLLLKRYQNRSIFEINKCLFGGTVGMVLNTILVLYTICFAALEVHIFAEVVNILLMPSTPLLVLAIVLLLPTVYLTWNGLNAVSTFSSVIFLFLAFIILIALLLFSQLHLTYLMPIGVAGIGKILKATIITNFAFLGPELVAFIYPYITDKKNSLKWAVSANLFTTFFFTFGFIISTALFGEDLLKTLKISLFDIPRFHQIIPMERIDYIFIILWLPLLESALRIYFFSAYHGANEVFNLKRSGWIYLLFILLIVLLNLIPRSFNEIFDYSKIISYWGFGVIVLFCICYLFSFINKRGTANQQSE